MSAVKEDSLDVKHSTEYVEGNILECASVAWKISNFSSRSRKADEFLNSPQFICSDATWQLCVYPNGLREKKSVGKVAIYLWKVHSTTEKHVVCMKFSIPHKKGSNNYETKYTFTEVDCGFGFSKALCRDEVLGKNMGYLQQGELTINCSITVSRTNTSEALKETAKAVTATNPAQKNDAVANGSSKGVNTLLVYDEPVTEADNLNALSEDFEALCNNARFADVILKSGKHEFPAHKLVLRSRSRVFEAMFEHDMQENRQDTVDLVDMEVDTVKDMLRYLYCGKVRLLPPADALSLYVAADRYDLQKLVVYCRQIIVNQLSIDNMCEITAVADLHNDQLLMGAVKSLLSKNMKEILKTDKWMIFAKEHLSLSLNLIQSAILGNFEILKQFSTVPY